MAHFVSYMTGFAYSLVAGAPVLRTPLYIVAVDRVSVSLLSSIALHSGCRQEVDWVENRHGRNLLGAEVERADPT